MNEFARYPRGYRKVGGDLTHNHLYILIYPCVLVGTITWELPHNVLVEAKQILITRYIDHWQNPALSCFLEVFELR